MACLQAANKNCIWFSANKNHMMCLIKILTDLFDVKKQSEDIFVNRSDLHLHFAHTEKNKSMC